MIDKDFLRNLFTEYGFDVSDKQANDFDQYAQTLVEWNEKINLTAITEPKDIVVKHFLDSAMLLSATEKAIPEGSTLIDVGTGAGFPSIPCKILREDIKLTLLDSLNKRINFLQTVSDEINQDNHCVHGSAEEVSRKADFREQYDFATARAVANLRDLSEYCLPFVKVGGYFIALKGYEIEDEIQESIKAISVLGGEIEKVEKYNLPEDNKRAIVVIKKISQTPTKYPRTRGKIKKQPII